MTRPFVIARVFDAPRDRVWQAWTESEHLKHWWGPKGFVVTHCKVDLRKGGMMHYCLRGPDGKDMWGRFVYRTIVAPEMLVFTTSFSDEKGGVTVHPMSPSWPREILATITFEAQGGKTRVTVQWVPVEGSMDFELKTFDAGRDSMKGGWTGTLDQCTAYLAGEMIMLKIIGIVVVVLVAGVLIYAATRPDSFRIERSAMIKAPPEKIFARVNEFKAWTGWSPWENIDPALKRTYSGPPNGKGAAYAWEGNKDVGSGSMEITESTSPSKIIIRLDFLKPFEAHNTADFTFAREGDATRVTWAMHGPSPYLSKLMSLVFSMDRMVGGMFEQGLANLKKSSET